jgi:hypothetical protein
MSVGVDSVLDFGGRNRLQNLGNAVNPGDAMPLAQVQAMVESNNWKDNVRVAAPGNVNIASPGATLDAVTMAAGDRVLLGNQTTASQNGLYIWNGAAVPMTRALDANTFLELESAIVQVDVEPGASNGGTRWRQTQVNGTLDTNNIVFLSDTGSAPAASTVTAGIQRNATLAETNAGTANTTVTSDVLAGWNGRALRYSQNIGDGSATSIDITHNLNSEDVSATFRDAAGNKAYRIVEWRVLTVNSIRAIFDTVAPALNSIRVTVQV